ncbi:hypothetical protein [Streptomyces europaeiscabiei]|uniref:hypothetical protein n=1 Tax=Streptomyces europaeiscabiei TaxID=146819 RepID=UPI0029A68C05|nr:hypothetical protein [Streptomyces europaeiscabiei]MDX3614447.1 hypothetical protein [Streptomyces europaeiscabiei]
MRDAKNRRSGEPGRVLLALSLLCAIVAPLAGCSTTDDQPSGQEVSADGTSTPTSDEQRKEQQEQEKRDEQQEEEERDDGGFSRAGRLSDTFGGGWPFYIKEVLNPSATEYVGKVAAVDCTSGEDRPATPPSQTVTVPPQGEAEASFEFSTENVTSSPRQICVTLTDEGGVRDETVDQMEAFITGEDETTPDTDASPDTDTDTDTPTPTGDGTTPGEPDSDASDDLG